MITGISKVPTLQCKAPNNTNITEHVMYTEDETETVINLTNRQHIMYIENEAETVIKLTNR